MRAANPFAGGTGVSTQGRDPHWHSLVQQYISGTISEEDARSLEQQLKSDAALRDWYLDALNLDAALAATVEAAEMTRTLPVSPVVQSLSDAHLRSLARTRRPFIYAAAVACLFLALGCGLSLLSSRRENVEVVRVSEDFSGPWKPGTRIAAQHLTWARGSFEMLLPSGVRVTIDGPSDLRVINPMKIRLNSGKVTADVGERGKGFVIETPEARVVDLGTVFGVDATRATRTDVVVFNGKVEVYEKGAVQPVALLSQGEGLRLERNRRTSRIVSVNGPDESGSWSAKGQPVTQTHVRWNPREQTSPSPLITSVGDSMSADEEEAKQWPSLRNFYRIVPGGLRDGALAFSDTYDAWTDVPAELVGADQVRTFAVDRYNWWMTLNVHVSRPSELFVFVDQRNPVPSWVAESFQDTGKTITLQFRPHQNSGRVAARYVYAVWSRRVKEPGIVSLGPPYENPPEDRKSFKPNNMFGVAAREIP